MKRTGKMLSGGKGVRYTSSPRETLQTAQMLQTMSGKTTPRRPSIALTLQMQKSLMGDDGESSNESKEEKGKADLKAALRKRVSSIKSQEKQSSTKKPTKK